MSSGLTEESAKFATIGIGAIMVNMTKINKFLTINQKIFFLKVVMTLVSIPLMDRTGRRTLHLYGLGGMFIFSIFITISFLIKASLMFIPRSIWILCWAIGSARVKTETFLIKNRGFFKSVSNLSA